MLVIIPILAVGAAWAITLLNRSFAVQRDVLEAVRLNDKLLQSQLNEEAGIRGFAVDGRRILLEQFARGRGNFASTIAVLAPALERIGIPDGDARIRSLAQTHGAWLARVASRAIRDRAEYAAHLQVVGKVLVERFRAESTALGDELQRRSDEAAAATQSAIAELAATTLTICVLVALLIVYASRRQRRLLGQIDAEQAIIGVLQSALINHLKPVAGVEVGTAYISATDGAAVGGDFFDVQPLDDRRGYFLVGDVSGKGVGAAVDTALVRHGIRSLLVVESDPGAVLSKFNEAFLAGRSSDEIFVVLFLGIIDTAAGVLRYASAAHAPAYLRRGSAVTELAVTGPLIGIDSPTLVTSEALELEAGDVLVIATDGLTEARDAGLVMLDERAKEWIRQAPAASPQALVDEIVARLRAYTPKMRDDLAILALRITGDPV